MPSKLNNKLGSIVIEDAVVANIAANAAMETYGIVGLAAQNTKDGLYELLRIENMNKGVAIRSGADNVIDIDLSVIMEYGVRIAVVAENIIDKIKFSVESSTGLQVNSVNVIVHGIRV